MLKAFCEDHEGGWKLISRNYIYDLDKVIWRWTVNVWAPLAEDEDEDELPFTDPEEDPEDEDTWPEQDPEEDE